MNYPTQRRNVKVCSYLAAINQWPEYPSYPLYMVLYYSRVFGSDSLDCRSRLQQVLRA